MPRTVVPEILDTLDPDAPEARHSRRDLTWINRCIGSARWFRRELATRLRPGDRVLEIGAGESELHRVAPDGVAWDAIDLAPRPPHWPPESRWHRVDLRAFHGWAAYTAVVGNLVYHHFDDTELGHIGAALRPHVRLILAHEPGRTAGAQRGFRWLCRFIGAHAVTRHDGRVSIDAGFQGDELARALGCRQPEWHWQVSSSLVGTHRLVAIRST